MDLYRLFVLSFSLLGLLAPSVDALIVYTTPRTFGLAMFSSKANEDPVWSMPTGACTTFENLVLSRYSCKKFRRWSESLEAQPIDTESTPSTGETSLKTASISDPSVVAQALHCLDLARRTPTAFNTQPYKVVLVHTAEQKLALSRYCLGPNGDRVRDSDCTAVFLADKQVVKTLPRFKEFLSRMDAAASAPNASSASTILSERKTNGRRTWLTMQFYITLFSSGYPLPRFLAAPISFGIRTAVAFIGIFTSRLYPLPSLANAETWSSKQAMMVAMTYILGCSSLGLATIPMEGKNGKKRLYIYTYLNTKNLTVSCVC